ncbi:hypothetical protein [Portibacter marinus]|uniref:hypothetical protein n=1 Tax=Portibacter marinus TaxID=2898660 RepID=UPI001F3D2EA1|nr:hypothetical protein [Portibacter marinus]
MNRAFLSVLVLLALIVGGITSCRYSENFYDRTDAMIEFSTDTLRFDTVFTTVGSATRSFKIYNPYNEALLLSRVGLDKGSDSFFRLNVNGVAGTEVEGTEIPPKDSIYVFAEVTIDPDMDLSISPFIIEEQLLVEVNGNQQKIILEAWGQNANYVPSNAAKGRLSLLSCDLETVIWDDPKPYVIYGILIVDSCTLELPPDCKVYVHGGVAFTEERATYNDGRVIVLKDGSLVANGTIDQPVIIQGDRLESEYEGVPAQWYGLQIFPESKGNQLRHTIVKDGITGITIDSLGELELDAVEVSNHATRALVSFHVGQLNIKNSLFHSAGAETLLVKYGGEVNIDYSTIAGYDGNQVASLYADNFRCTDEIFCSPILVNPLFINLRNTVIAGQSEDEILFVDGTFNEEPNVFNYQLTNCALDIDTLLNVFPNFFDQCENCLTINKSENLFADLDEKNFHLDTLSQLEMQAIPLSGIFSDLDGNLRDVEKPDIGCYEYQ